MIVPKGYVRLLQPLMDNGGQEGTVATDSLVAAHKAKQNLKKMQKKKRKKGKKKILGSVLYGTALCPNLKVENQHSGNTQ